MLLGVGLGFGQEGSGIRIDVMLCFGSPQGDAGRTPSVEQARARIRKLLVKKLLTFNEAHVN